MSDSLKQAVEGLEVAWRRLREVLDGPDVAAALVERQAVRPMSTAPRDGTFILVHRKFAPPLKLRYDDGDWIPGARHFASRTYPEWTLTGWSPVRPEAHQWPRPMSTAPLDRTAVYLHFGDGRKVWAYYRNTFEDGPKCWGTGPNFTDLVVGVPIGWSPVK